MKELKTQADAGDLQAAAQLIPLKAESMNEVGRILAKEDKEAARLIKNTALSEKGLETIDFTPGFQILNDDLDKLLNPPTDTKDTSADKQTQFSGSQFVMFAFEKMYKEAGSPKTLKEIDESIKKCLGDEEVMSHTF